MAKLCEGTGVNANNAILSGVLVTVGDLARVVGRFLNDSADFMLHFNGVVRIHSVFFTIVLLSRRGLATKSNAYHP